MLLAALMVGMMLSCNEPAHHRTYTEQADSLINEAYKNHDYDSLITLSEELEASGEMSAMKACYWRGYAYSSLRKMRMAEQEWKEAVSQHIW